MLTSEQQKIYNVKVPKGGYGYYTLYRGIYDPENNIDERPSYAQTGDLFEPEGSSVVYKATRKNGKTTWAIDENAQRQSESGESGGGSGGGGAEKFVVTLTEDDDTRTADKTVAEIVAAYAANQVVVCNVTFSDLPCELPVKSVVTNAGEDIVIFCGTYNNGEAIAIGTCVLFGTECVVETTPIPTSFNTPMVVTLTAGSTEGQFVGDKTHQEVFEAFIAGRNVVFYAPAVGLAEAVRAAENGEKIAINTGSFTSAGSATDYITVTAG